MPDRIPIPRGRDDGALAPPGFDLPSMGVGVGVGVAQIDVLFVATCDACRWSGDIHERAALAVADADEHDEINH